MSIDIDRWWKIQGVRYPIHRAKISVPSLSGSAARMLFPARCLFLPLSIVICIVMPEASSKRFDDSIVSSVSPWLISRPKLMSIDIDDERYTMSSIRYLPQAYHLSRAASAKLFCLSQSFTFSLFLCLPTHLSLPTCERLHAAAAAGERHSVKVPHQKPATAAWYHARHSILSRPTWSMDNAILGVNRRSPGEGEAPRVVLDSDAKWIEWWIWASAFGAYTHRTFRAKCGFLIILTVWAIFSHLIYRLAPNSEDTL